MASANSTTTPASRWSYMAAALLACFYLVTSLHIASHRLLWYDELRTTLIARLPGWTTIWRIVAQGADTMPAPYYMLVRVFDNLFGHSEVALRLPSALAMTAGLVVTFDCARRLTDGLHGLIALCSLTCSCLPYYGYEARPYSLYFLFAALSLWVWTNAGDEKRSSAVFFGAVLFLGVAVHYDAVMCLVPFALWEIANWKPWRPPSPKMIGGLLGVLCAVAVLSVPELGQFHSHAEKFPMKPPLHALLAVFPDLFPDGLFLLVLAMAWIAMVGAQDRTIGLPPMKPGERVGWFFLFVPLAGYVLAVGMTHPFRYRHVMGALPGISVAFSCCLWRHFREVRRVSGGILLLLALSGLVRQVQVTRHPEWIDPSPGKQQTFTRQMLNLEGTLRNEGKQFNVVCMLALYAEVRQYSKHPEDYGLLIFSDEFNPLKPDLLSSDVAHAELTMSRYYPVQVWRLEDLKKRAPETALIEPSSNALEALRQAGLLTRVRFAEPLEVVYLESAR